LFNTYEDELQEYESLNKSIEIECCINNLKCCGVGYRTSYMKKASDIFLNQLNVNDFFKMDYEEAFETILKVPGVGPKVADCILLYGFGFKEAFPSDVWIKRIISKLYFNGKDISATKARDFGMDKFGDYAGYAQLYLFHYARKSGLMDKISNNKKNKVLV
jgi:N-glycosylase/DNA lyase